ncbi:MAG: acetyl-CoA carboxylase biotin carboxylase subunit [Planctomycetota bacterium]|jgi:acetyl-CoA carboxylase biotin carboxylase subunit
MTRRFEKILVANRGEIARRVLRGVRELGIASVAVYSDADARAPHVAEADEAVRIGPAPSAESYLAIDPILAAARAVGADAIHPGYGFLAENADFAERCDEASFAFIGPPAQVIRKMGNKREAKALLAAAGVPVIPGVSGEGMDDAQLAAEARKIGYPVLVKACAGGGGKGMRVVASEVDLAEALAAARREAAAAFGDDTLLLERYFDAPRHVEIQIFGDTQGQLLHCFERECSIQRRFQKIVEEAPSPAVDDQLRREMGAAAVAAGKAIGYVGAGTVEFLVDAAGDFHFLEVNTRLQVEHPVTEAVTGLDLVHWQIQLAQGEPLPLAQEELTLRGHAIEARLYAEDPANDFLPATGRIALWEPPELPGVRIDSGVAAGSEVGIHYDPLLAKLIAVGPSRGEAIRRLVAALRRLGVGGVTTNRDFLIAVLEHPAFEAGKLDTHFIERHLPPATRRAPRSAAAERLHAIAAALHAHERRRGEGPLPPSIPSGWRNNRWRAQDVSYRIDSEPAAEPIEVLYVATGPGHFEVEVGGEKSQVVITESGDGVLGLEVDGVRRRLHVAVDGDRSFVHGPLGSTELTEIPRFPPADAAELTGGCLAPMPGVVRNVAVGVGDRVEEGSVLLVLEAMKMEHQLVAYAPAVVKEVRVEVGQMVDPDAVLIVLESDA